jgi:cell division protein FtsL
MSKLDRIKAEISFHEKMFFTAIAMMLGLLAQLSIPLKTYLYNSAR